MADARHEAKQILGSEKSETFDGGCEWDQRCTMVEAQEQRVTRRCETPHRSHDSNPSADPPTPVGLCCVRTQRSQRPDPIATL